MELRYLRDDFREFLTCLNEAGVEYRLVGGHAVAYHGYFRPKQDLDVWVAVSEDYAGRLVNAIQAFFGGSLKGLSPEWFLDGENVTRFGAVPNLIEILPKISGGDFQCAFARRVTATMDGQRRSQWGQICKFNIALSKASCSGYFGRCFQHCRMPCATAL